jgi:hypothetical protein
MAHIVLTEEQARIVVESAEPVEVRDTHGQVVASIRRFSAIEREVMERHLRRQGLPKEPGIPSERVRALLLKLEEVRQSEGIDEAKVKELVRRTVAGEPL